MSRVDLHVHSTASDGKYSPSTLVAKAAALNLAYLALADHDSVDGIKEALAAARGYPELKIIPAVEISTDLPDGEAHILGYFIDFTDPNLETTLARFRSSRERRAQAMIHKLHGLGIDIDWDRVREIAGDGSVGRPHIARAMLEKGHIRALNNAFSGYIEHGGPAYVEREKMKPAEAVTLVVNAGGLPVLAHPFTIADPEAIIGELKPAGLVGIEAYYGKYAENEVKTLEALAARYGLIPTGGSDYHGLDESNETPLGGAEVPLASAEQLISMADPGSLKLAGW